MAWKYIRKARHAATQALGAVGGDKAAALMGKAFKDKHPTLGLCEQALADSDVNVRTLAAEALGCLDEDQAGQLLCRRAEVEQARPVLENMRLIISFKADPRSQAALKQVDERLAKLPKPQSGKVSQPPEDNF